MTDYEIQGPTRVCSATGRELRPGEPFHAVLTEREGKFVRTDYAADAWPGAPPEAVAHWSGRVPADDKPRKPVINDDVLLGCFDRLKDAADADGLNFRYVAALLLDAAQAIPVRGRCPRRSRPRRAHPQGRDRTGTIHQVIDPRLTDDQIAAVQAEVFRVLGWE